MESGLQVFTVQDRWQTACVGEQLADVNVVDRVARGGGGVMVWADVCYGQHTQVHFIDVILNAQRYHDKNLRPTAIHRRPSPHVAA